ncbi:hypothetical protein K443DRAFT_681478 [Laccaria amethystina LaAM-08-1]|uniref:Uncharacterized protein n=1 Tax=Laccaria amethystina LaAM-08-1 TaxID=1095629 RepID=A0A0C9WLQ4_9AGAR|nr:hypothetical protein K443DRAFT_681478 [Laccaria amethystina LaAM-08-1]
MSMEFSCDRPVSSRPKTSSGTKIQNDYVPHSKNSKHSCISIFGKELSAGDLFAATGTSFSWTVE